jgi:two-component system sensor histidine kinase ResE
MENRILHILLVEDDPGMVVLCTDRLIEGRNWRITIATTAAECRRQLIAQRFDVILLDRGLPDCDGAELIGELLTTQADAVIIMLTGADSAASATETLKLGACDYVVKQPNLSHLDELPAIIERWVERRQWQRERGRLQHEMELLQTAIRNAGDAVVMADGDLRVQFFNAAAEKLLGWTAEEAIGQVLPWVPRGREAESVELAERARLGDPLIGVETVRQRRDGSFVEVSLTLTAVVDDDGSVRAYVGVLRDITERKELERARADFAAMLTHDIRNPLSVVRGCAQMLAESELPQDHAESVGAIHNAAETIDRLVIDFLMSATIESGSLSLVRGQVPIADLVSTVVDQFRTAATRQQIHLHADHASDLGFVDGDRLQLERALGNLINNAIKYTGPGGRISVGALRRNGSVFLEVNDTGQGIHRNDLPYVFDKYRRVSNSSQIDGAGLGLYIVRHLVEAHGGSVSVSSTVGHGSTFIMRLPALDIVAEPSRQVG